MRTIAQQKIDGQYLVTLDQRADGTFRVSYGLDVRDRLDYASAAHEFGECVMHAAACAGLIVDSED